LLRLPGPYVNSSAPYEFGMTPGALFGH
jgi:hypothetical protein